ncbi:MAG TPA: pitrilysin family protein [Bryobacteraceae bacterium]|nr:pitrilysin family protein [Bryobacteraceae bacterium]
MRFLKLITAGLLAGALVSAQQIDIPNTKFVLPNGLTVIVHEDHKAPIVALNVWYHVASKNELTAHTGFAHLFEHLMFGGSENIQDRYINIMERVGATNLNGTTNEDRTNYFETVPVSAFDYALFAESDRMGHFYKTINQQTLDLQRGVVQNEKRQDENQPYAVAEDLIVRATYPVGHPYSHTVIGSMDDLNAASVADVQQWFKTYYSPTNATLAIAGDVTVAEAKEKVTKYFGDIPPGPPIAHQNAWVAKMTGVHRETVQDRVPLARVYKVWNVPQFGAAQADYLNLATDVLASGKSSRLYKRLVYDDQIATRVSADINEREIAGQVIIEVTARKGKSLDDVEKAIDEELAKFLKDGPTPAELDRAKTSEEAHFIRGLERVGGFGGKSDVLAMNQTYLGDPNAYKLSLSRLQHATAADLQDTAKAWLSDGEYILEILPFPEYKAVAESVDRSKMPAVPDPPESHLPTLQRTTLANGLKVVLAERHDVPVVNFWLATNAGYAADQSAAPGTAKLTSAAMTSGAGKRDALEISDELESLGAEIRATSDLDFTVVSLSALKAKLDPSLALYTDILLHPTFPAADFKRQQTLQLAAIEQEESNPVQMGLHVLPALLYGKGNAYSEPYSGSGTRESVQHITREDLVKWHREWFKPNNATLIVVGDATMSELKPKLESLLGSWSGGKAPDKTIAKVDLPSKPEVYLIDKPGALQSVILAATLAPPTNNPQEFPIEEMNDAFAGTFSARLNMNLREDKHWSYGASAFLRNARGQRAYMMYAPVQTDKTKESLVEMEKEVHNLIESKPITQEELDRVQRQDVLELAGARENMAAVGSAIRDLVEYDLPENYWDTYAAKVRAVTLGEVNDEAKTLIDPDKFIWVIVGDRSKIEDGVKSLNIGPLHHLRPDGTESSDQ